MQDLIAEYLECASRHAAIDYSSPASVQHGNEAAERLAAIARALLADHEIEAALEPILRDPVAGIWAAHHLLEVARVKGPLEQSALDVIASVAEGSSLNSVGEAMWLRQYQRIRLASEA